jgi:hypothetical protein
LGATSDRDGLSDYVDGFNIGGSADITVDDLSHGDQLYPLTITIPDGVDVDNIMLTIEYDASDPGGIVPTLTESFPLASHREVKADEFCR